MEGNQKIKDSIKVLILIFIFTLINIYVPILNFLVFFIWPIPIVYLVVKHGISNAFTVIIIAAIINGFLINPFIGLVTIIGVGFIGFTVGGCLRENISPFRTLLFSIISVLISQLLILFIFYYNLGIDFNYFVNIVQEYLEQVPELSQIEGVVEYQLQLIRELYPAILVISSMVIGIIYYYVSVYYLNRKGFQLKLFTSLKYWYFSRWVISLGLIITLFLNHNPILYNLNIILFFVCFIQGVAVILYYISDKGNFLKLLFGLAIFIIPFFPFILIILGLSDMWFNLRKL